MKYKCIKSFSVDTCDDDGFSDGGWMTVPKESIWEEDVSKFRMVGGNDSIRLEHDNLGWIEILESTLNKFFVKE